MSGKPLPYSVWVKQSGDWRCVFSTHNPPDAHSYATQNVVHGNNVQRIEVRDLTGTLETVFDSTW